MLFIANLRYYQNHYMFRLRRCDCQHLESELGKDKSFCSVLQVFSMYGKHLLLRHHLFNPGKTTIHQGLFRLFMKSAWEHQTWI